MLKGQKQSLSSSVFALSDLKNFKPMQFINITFLFHLSGGSIIFDSTYIVSDLEYFKPMQFMFSFSIFGLFLKKSHVHQLPTAVPNPTLPCQDPIPV